MLEASGIFTPAAIAHFRQGVSSPVMKTDTNQCKLIVYNYIYIHYGYHACYRSILYA